MTHVFLSYKAEDRARLAPLVAALEADGLSMWWDARIGGGDQWRETIERQLEAADCVIVAWSRRSVGPEGNFVRDEASRAQRRGVYLPIRIDKVGPPLGFGETQVLSLQGWKGDRSDSRYQALLAAVRNKAGAEPPAYAPPASRRGIDRRSAIVAGSAAAASVAGLGAWWWSRSANASGDSIAVLPFANLSNDPAQAYFSDGIAEELRSALSRIARLKVVARTSSEAVRDADAKTAARKLGVDNILTGSVRRTPTTIRISAQLIDGGEGLEQWSQVYDRPVGDALQIQTDIANKVADALTIHLDSSAARALLVGGTRNSAAQDLLLQARELVAHDDSAGALQRALGMLDSAITLDPKYAHAYAGKGRVLAFLSGQAESAAEARQQLAAAERQVRRAIMIAPTFAEARGALAGTLYLQLRLREAVAQFEVMDSLPGEDHGDFENVDGYSWALVDIGRGDHALQRAERMIALDPLNPAAYHTRAVVLSRMRRFPEALQADEQALKLAPDLVWARAWRGMILMQLGKLDEAATALASVSRELGPWIAWQAILAERQGDRAKSDHFLRQLQEGLGDSANYQYAQVYSQQGRKDEAIAALEQAWEVRDPGLTVIKVDPMLDPLRGDERFNAIVRKIDFPT